MSHYTCNTCRPLIPLVRQLLSAVDRIPLICQCGDGLPTCAACELDGIAEKIEDVLKETT